MSVILPIGFKVNFDALAHIEDDGYSKALQSVCDKLDSNSIEKGINVIATDAKNEALKLITRDFFSKFCTLIREDKLNRKFIYLFDPNHISFEFLGNLDDIDDYVDDYVDDDIYDDIEIAASAIFIHLDGDLDENESSRLFAKKNKFDSLCFFSEKLRKDILEKVFYI